ncbi:NADAR family protein [Aureivirga sp. CE67]|uniref:NADAR family protein n=1 Tax=Aureivirga sp. CE67 TaxID=1788983 RepID=UPI0018C97748|nr:NADAR family protein [Aureivirga sp. CE67]
MKQNYNLEWLKNTTEENTPLKYLFFWGHSKKKNDNSLGKYCLSQWFKRDFSVDGITYKSTEHWMMAEKAKLFEDDKIYQKIIQCTSPGEAKTLGRKVRNFEEKKWLENRYEIVVKGNFHKFSQNNDLKEYLLNTKERVIVEASPVDTIWGIGLSVDSSNIQNIEKWRGLNLLGFALMEVRDQLRS